MRVKLSVNHAEYYAVLGRVCSPSETQSGQTALAAASLPFLKLGPRLLCVLGTMSPQACWAPALAVGKRASHLHASPSSVPGPALRTWLLQVHPECGPLMMLMETTEA